MTVENAMIGLLIRANCIVMDNAGCADSNGEVYNRDRIAFIYDFN